MDGSAVRLITEILVDWTDLIKEVAQLKLLRHVMCVNYKVLVATTALAVSSGRELQ